MKMTVREMVALVMYAPPHHQVCDPVSIRLTHIVLHVRHIARTEVSERSIKQALSYLVKMGLVSLTRHHDFGPALELMYIQKQRFWEVNREAKRQKWISHIWDSRIDDKSLEGIHALTHEMNSATVPKNFTLRVEEI
jgi:alcohol dehydrogenase YqhD (iron-dependent ADH family)